MMRSWCTYNLWLEGRLYLAILDLFPVDAPKEEVASHILLTSSSTAKPLLGVLSKEALAHVFRLLAQVLRVRHIVVGDCSEQLLFVLAVKRRLSHEHLVKKHPIRPPIHRLAIRLIEYYLWCNIVRRSAESLCGLVVGDALLTHAKVGYLDVAVCVQEHIVQLQVAIDYAARV